jgi:hypothetical protein
MALLNYPINMKDKSIFDLTPQDFQDCEDWMRDTKAKNEDFVQTKSQLYSFNFLKGEPEVKGQYEWDGTVTKRLSSIRISSVSTLYTLGDDEEDENIEIPSIENLDLRISRVSLNSAYSLQPDRR